MLEMNLSKTIPILLREIEEREDKIDNNKEGNGQDMCMRNEETRKVHKHLNHINFTPFIQCRI